MNIKTFILRNEAVREALIGFIRAFPINPESPMCVVFKDMTRSLDQNALLWPLLECFESQKLWPVDGELVKVDSETWKDILTAAFKGERMKFAKGINGGLVMIGLRTSTMGKKEFSEFIEFIYAEGSNLGIDFDRKKAA